MEWQSFAKGLGFTNVTKVSANRVRPDSRDMVQSGKKGVYLGSRLDQTQERGHLVGTCGLLGWSHPWDSCPIIFQASYPSPDGIYSFSFTEPTKRSLWNADVEMLGAKCHGGTCGVLKGGRFFFHYSNGINVWPLPCPAALIWAKAGGLS